MFIKRHIRLALGVGMLVGCLAGGLGAMFPDMAVGDASSVASSWTPLMKALFGDPLAGFTNIYAWLDLQIFHVTLWMVFGTLASILASRIVAQEAEQKTLDVLLSIPLSRGMILTSRLLGLGVLLAMAALPVIAGCFVAVAVQELAVLLGLIVLSVTTCVLLSLVLAMMTLLISIWKPRQIPAVAIAMSIAGSLFFTEEMLVPVLPWLGSLSYINPFHWYNTGDILIRGILSPWPILGLLVISLVCMMFSIAAFTICDAPT
jgi:ABC-2 type transport system permease protein